MNAKSKTNLILRVFEIADFIPKVGDIMNEIPLVFDLAFLKIHQHFFPTPIPGGVVIQAYNSQGELLFVPGIMKEIKYMDNDFEKKATVFEPSLNFAPINISRILNNIDTKKLIKTVAKYNELETNPPISIFLREILKEGVEISEIGQIIDTSKILEQ